LYSGGVWRTPPPQGGAPDPPTQARHTEAAGVPAEYPAGEIPLTGQRPGRAEDVAELVLFLAAGRSRHVSGSPVWIDGAQSLLM